ncbi:MAG TPA: ribonuclease catalytic domain-containing protein, partial [Candidatus Limnocylindria bacterium]|nr:ribonuclease catalytic domain-containing protein [Candidatus Limnocylindria bacterium]
MDTEVSRQRSTLRRIARRAMIERGLLPDFSHAALAELDGIRATAAGSSGWPRDMRNLPWASIDNDDSRDLDQLTVAETMPEGALKVLVAIADVDAIVRQGKAIDDHARQNTTSVYTAAEIFPMLPEKLSTDLTSLGYREDRPAIVVEMVFNEDGSLRGSDLYGATVRNHAKLAYNSVGAWLEGKGPAPAPIADVEGLAENLRIQDRVAQQLKAFRHEHGALDLETIEARPVFDGDGIRDLEAERRNRAKELIEDFMIAANGVTARYLKARKYPSLRRVVRSPKRWERIVEVASRYGATLPPTPDPKALAEFLALRKAADPLRFPDLSLTIIKLMGAGEYVPEFPEETASGHFGLAVRDYTHSTAPNRRY